MKKKSVITVSVICIVCILCTIVSSASSSFAPVENKFTNTAAIYPESSELPLDNILNDGGYTSIFRSIACIGDSLASGEFESTSEGTTSYHDMFEYSWGQYIARMCGNTVYNFSKGGMNAQAYCESFAAEKGYWDEQYAAQAYIIALGVNDIGYTTDLGSTADVDLTDWNNNTNNFAGFYAQIIQRYKEIQPDAKFFLVTLPKSENDSDAYLHHRELMYDFAEIFDNTYVIDLMQYGPTYNAEFKARYFMGSHMNPMGYQLSARLISSYIDYIVRHNPDDFKEVAFIGTDLKGNIG